VVDIGEIQRDLEKPAFRLNYMWLALREVLDDLRGQGFVGDQLEWSRLDLDRLATALDAEAWRQVGAGQLTGEHALENLHCDSQWLNSGDRSTRSLDISPPHSSLTRALDVLRFVRSMMGPDDRLRLWEPQ
jgi:hypothetical protein